MNSSDEATKWKQELRRQVVEAAIDRHDDDLSLVRAVAINDAYPVIAAAVRAEAVADERRRTLEWALAKAEDEVAVGDESWFQPEHGETATECTVRFIKALLAAGSVPVATPPAEPAEPAQAEPMVGIFDVIAVQQNYRRHLLSLDPSPEVRAALDEAIPALSQPVTCEHGETVGHWASTVGPRVHWLWCPGPVSVPKESSE